MWHTFLQGFGKWLGLRPTKCFYEKLKSISYGNAHAKEREVGGMGQTERLWVPPIVSRYRLSWLPTFGTTCAKNLRWDSDQTEGKRRSSCWIVMHAVLVTRRYYDVCDLLLKYSVREEGTDKARLTKCWWLLGPHEAHSAIHGVRV